MKRYVLGQNEVSLNHSATFSDILKKSTSLATRKFCIVLNRSPSSSKTVRTADLLVAPKADWNLIEEGPFLSNEPIETSPMLSSNATFSFTKSLSGVSLGRRSLPFDNSHRAVIVFSRFSLDSA